MKKNVFALSPFISTIGLTNEQRNRLWQVRLQRYRRDFRLHVLPGGKK